MKVRVALVVLLVFAAGCAAPAPDAPSPTTAAPTPTETTTERPPATTTSETATPEQPGGVTGEIRNTTVDNGIVTATIQLRNREDTTQNRSIAVRFVENDSHAMVGEISLEATGTKTLVVPLRTYGDDPETLTVQLRIDGEIVAERAATR